MISAAYTQFTHIQAAHEGPRLCTPSAGATSTQVRSLRMGAGERIRTADLPFTRRLLCLLSYTGGGLRAW
jgi:hypothetical protein